MRSPCAAFEMGFSVNRSPLLPLALGLSILSALLSGVVLWSSFQGARPLAPPASSGAAVGSTEELARSRAEIAELREELARLRETMEERGNRIALVQEPDAEGAFSDAEPGAGQASIALSSSLGDQLLER